jgi:hypothetical protein
VQPRGQPHRVARAVDLGVVLGAHVGGRALQGSHGGSELAGAGHRGGDGLAEAGQPRRQRAGQQIGADDEVAGAELGELVLNVGQQRRHGGFLVGQALARQLLGGTRPAARRLFGIVSVEQPLAFDEPRAGADGGVADGLIRPQQPGLQPQVDRAVAAPAGDQAHHGLGAGAGLGHQPFDDLGAVVVAEAAQRLGALAVLGPAHQVDDGGPVGAQPQPVAGEGAPGGVGVEHAFGHRRVAAHRRVVDQQVHQPALVGKLGVQHLRVKQPLARLPPVGAHQPVAPHLGQHLLAELALVAVGHDRHQPGADLAVTVGGQRLADRQHRRARHHPHLAGLGRHPVRPGPVGRAGDGDDVGGIVAGLGGHRPKLRLVDRPQAHDDRFSHVTVTESRSSACSRSTSTSAGISSRPARTSPRPSPSAAS